jgi:hypothetical protein
MENYHLLWKIDEISEILTIKVQMGGGGGYIGNLKVLLEILEALPPNGRSKFPRLL